MSATATRAHIELSEIALFELRAALRGDLLTPEHPEYETARRVWNGAVDIRPALIVRCRAAQDAALAIGFARGHGLPIAVRSGGHNPAGLAVAEGGLMIDLAQMKGLQIDPAARVARAEPGLTLGELVPALAAHGLATTTGTCAGTGLGGSTLGGGIGWLAGSLGLGVDNLLAVELASADGRLLRASADELPELFWGLRGGGGNFGVVTSMELRLHALGDVLGGMLVYPLAAAGAALRRFRTLRAVAGDSLGALAVLTTFPGVGPALMLQLCYAGADLAAGEALLAPLRQGPAPALDTIRPMPYDSFFMAHTPPAPNGRSYYDSAYPLDSLSDAAIEGLIACAGRLPTPLSSIVIHELHGAATRVDPAATAFALRRPHHLVVHAAGWDQGDGVAPTAWAEECLAAMAPHAGSGLYVNFMGRGSPAEVRAAYGPNYARLAAIKAAYDPTNIFRRNQNIQPAAGR